MSILTITTGQAAIITATDPYLDQAFQNGVQDNLNNLILNPMLDYDKLSNTNKTSVRNIFESAIAALIKALNIPGIWPATRFTGTVTIAKITGGGSNGSLTFTDGILTARTDPS